MPSVITHALVGVGLEKVFFVQRMPRFFWDMVIVCVLIPDIDVIGFRLGIPYGAVWGHRGVTHSLFFALIVGLVAATILLWRKGIYTRRWWLYAAFFTTVTASNGLLDAMTNGGYGVALLAPFNITRLFLPWRPIEVSPIGLKGFVSQRGLEVIWSEILYVWIPLVLLIIISRLVRRFMRRIA